MKTRFLGFLILAAAITSIAEFAGAQINPNCLRRLSEGQNRFRTRVSAEALQKLSRGFEQMAGKLGQDRYALLVDYTKSSREKRSYLLDLKACEIVSRDYVIHGGSVYNPVEQHFGDVNGDGVLDRCIHANGSRKNMTRPGLYLTRGCHHTLQSGWTDIGRGCHGVKLVGLEESNKDVLRAGVVMHEHEAISNDSSIKPAGQGCPAYPPGVLRNIVRYGMFDRALLFVHAPQCETPNRGPYHQRQDSVTTRAVR